MPTAGWPKPQPRRPHAPHPNNTPQNAVVGVTSWVYDDDEGSYKIQGASQFAINNEYPRSAYGTRGGGNIGALVDFACDSAAGVAAGWGLQAKGFCR